MEKSNITEIQNEYKRIDDKWLGLHYRTSVGLVAFAFFAECIIGLYMCNSDGLNTTIQIYLYKYLAVPFVLNTVFILTDYWVLKTAGFSQIMKVYVVSLLLVAISYVLFTVHIIFFSLYFIFAVPVLLTTIYGNYILTSITSISSITAMITAELFTKWDSDKINIMGDSMKMADFLIALFILLAFSAVCIVIIRFEREKNAASIQLEMERHQLQKRLHRDELTGVYNRVAFRSSIRDMEEDSPENKYIFAMIDVDNFKDLNNNLGHLAGDHCLAEFGRILKANCGDAKPFRYGGDEFCILFRNWTIENVEKTCAKIQKEFDAVSVGMAEGISLTVSFGIACYSKGMIPSRLIFNSDKALYEAKTEKNAIHVFKDSAENISTEPSNQVL